MFGALALLIGFWRLSLNGLGDLYYTAADISGSHSLRSLFFATFDRTGIMAVDKPPLGLVGPAVAIHLFGLSSWTVLGPQVVLFSVGVALFCGALQRWFNRRTGVIGAAILMLTPMSVAVARSNNPDELLVLFTIVSVIAVVEALRDERLRHVVVAGIAIGLAFTTKQLQAVVTVPAIVAALLLFSPGSRLRRLARTMLFSLVAAGVSLAWVLAVDHVPATFRPYIPNSPNNTESTLAFGFNGTHRVGKLAVAVQHRPGFSGVLHRLVALAVPQRTLLGDHYSAQTSWLLIASFICALIIIGMRRSSPTTRFFTVWTVVHVVVLAYMPGKFSAYYLAPLIPGLAALVAVTADLILPVLSADTSAFERRPVGFTTVSLAVLMAAVGLPAFAAARSVGTFAAWSTLAFAVVAVGASIAMRYAQTGRGGVVVENGGRRRTGMRALRILTVVAAGSCLIVPPMPFTYADIARAQEAVSPRASLAGVPRSSKQQKAINANDADLIAFVRAHSGDRSLALASSRETVSAMLTIDGSNVVPLGGFFGTDPYPALPTLQGYITSGQLRWVAIPDLPPGRPVNMLPPAVVAGPWGPWVRDTCRKLPSPEFGAPSSSAYWSKYANTKPLRTPLALYDCGVANGGTAR